MKRLAKNLVGAVAIAVLTLQAAAARAAFENVEVSPRARAMGGAWAAAQADVYAALHNPASLAWATQTLGAASYVRPFGYDFSSLGTVAGIARLPGAWGGLGAAFRQFGVEYQDEFLTREVTLSLAQGVKLRSDRQSELAVGWAVHLYTLDYGLSVGGLDPGNATSVGLDLGATAVVRERTRVGFRVLNLNNPRLGSRDHEELPRSLALGVSYAPYSGVETAIDLTSELGETVQYRGGTEFQLSENVRLRAGLTSDPAILTAGLGLHYAGIGLDYGFSTGGGVLSESHHIGLQVALPARE